MKITKRVYKKRKSQNKSQKKKSQQKIKGGNNNIQNYALNTYNEDPQYMQISERNVVQHGTSVQHGSGKRKTKKNKKKSMMKKGGGSFFDFAANQSSNYISNFPNNSTNILFGNNTQNSAAYVQPISNKVYSDAVVE